MSMGRLVACSLVLAGLSLQVASAGAEGVSEDPSSRMEVGPGIYLASASRSAQVDEASSPNRSPERRKIFDGGRSSVRRWPWAVSIGYLPISRTDAHKNHLCGGTLVAPTIVVTAAHCMTLGPNRNFRPPEEFDVVTGRTRLSSDAGQEHQIADYTWFVNKNGRPLWNPRTREWDVVFLELVTPARQQTIKIAGSGEESVWVPGQRAIVTGWGLTREDNELGADRLRQGRMKMVSNSACESVWGPLLFDTVMVCAGDSGAVDACAGDSGGPLVVPTAHGGHRLVGSVSWGADCGDRGFPGVYARLASNPIRGALRRGIEAVAGVNVVGSGNAAPPNQFAFGRLHRHPRRGTASLMLRVPGRGVLRMHRTDRVRRAVTRPSGAGAWRLPVRLRGTALRRLIRTGRARVRTRVTYESFGGERTKSVRVVLTKRD